jgi:hypothetical protein
MLEDKHLGTYVSEAITALTGKEPCEGCKRRAALLNEIGRRGFLKGGTFAVSLAKNTMLKGLWHLAGAQIPASMPEALAFIRQSNTFQLQLFYRTGLYAPLNDLFKEIIAHREHFKPGTLGYAWMSQLNFFSDEVLPGWMLDFALISEGYPRSLPGYDGPIDVNNGYRLVLRGTVYSFVTDELGIIYRASTLENAPSASSLGAASSFPGAVALGAISAEKPSAWQRIKDFFVPTVYATGCCFSQSGCAACACCDCLACNSCNQHCFSFPPPGRCVFNAGCGTCNVDGHQINCGWVALGCGSSACNCNCAVLFGGCCGLGAGCTSCPSC